MTRMSIQIRMRRGDRVVLESDYTRPQVLLCDFCHEFIAELEPGAGEMIPGWRKIPWFRDGRTRDACPVCVKKWEDFLRVEAGK